MGLGLFKPTKVEGDIVIYSKWCVPCIYPEEILAINYYASEHGLDTQVIRTVYRPADHNQAIEFWTRREGAPKDESPEAQANYPTFVVYKEKVTSLKDFIEMIKQEQLKDKRVKGAVDNDMQGLSKTKGAGREDRVAGSVPQSQKANESRSQGERQ